MDIWGDYSGGRPGGAALRAAGFSGVIRYIGIGSAGKRLTAAEYTDLAAHGITVHAVVEGTTNDADGGYSAGTANARAALADASVIGLPAASIIFAANDKPGYSQASVDYVRGFRDVLGLARTGAYGFGAYLGLCRSQGVASAFWQAGPSPSRTGTAGWVNVWQRNGTTSGDGPGTPAAVTVGGIAVDCNNLLIPLTGDAMSFDLTSLVAVPTLDADGNYAGDQKDANGNVVMVPFQDLVRFANATGWFNINQNKAQSATIAGLSAAITALASASSSPVTADQIKQMVDEAIAQHVQISGTVTVTGAPAAPAASA